MPDEQQSQPEPRVESGGEPEALPQAPSEGPPVETAPPQPQESGPSHPEAPAPKPKAKTRAKARPAVKKVPVPSKAVRMDTPRQPRPEEDPKDIRFWSSLMAAAQEVKKQDRATKYSNLFTGM